MMIRISAAKLLKKNDIRKKKKTKNVRALAHFKKKQ